MGGKSGNVTRLPLRERARTDPVQILKMRRELGAAGAALVMQRRVEAITAALTRMEALRGPVPAADPPPGEERSDTAGEARASASDRAERFCRAGRRLGRLAAEVGLVRIARVVEDVLLLSRGADRTAEAAAWARLLRLCAAAIGTEIGIRRGRI